MILHGFLVVCLLCFWGSSCCCCLNRLFRMRFGLGTSVVLFKGSGNILCIYTYQPLSQTWTSASQLPAPPNTLSLKPGTSKDRLTGLRRSQFKYQQPHTSISLLPSGPTAGTGHWALGTTGKTATSRLHLLANPNLHAATEIRPI